MKYTLKYWMYCTEYKSEFDSLFEALFEAVETERNGTGSTEKILRGRKVIWDDKKESLFDFANRVVELGIEAQLSSKEEK